MTSAKSPRHWIWIRGLARHSGHWAFFEDAFREKFPDDIVEMLDVRGNGNQAHAPSFLTVAENVRDLRARSQILKQGPVHLLTISLGSMIGIKWAELYPEDVASLTVMNTSDGKNSLPHQRLRFGNLKNLLTIVADYKDPVAVELKIMEMIAQNVSAKEELARKFAETPPTKVSNITRQLVAASMFRLPKTAPHLPVLILGSKGDRFVNPICSQRIADAWGTSVHWHDKAGHDIPLEDPNWVSDELEHFLS